MTEEQARKKWCPMARSHGYFNRENPQESAVTVNRGDFGHPDSDCLCIASDCMMWRSFGTNGYCGLAGKS